MLPRAFLLLLLCLVIGCGELRKPPNLPKKSSDLNICKYTGILEKFNYHEEWGFWKWQLDFKDGTKLFLRDYFGTDHTRICLLPLAAESTWYFRENGVFICVRSPSITIMTPDLADLIEIPPGNSIPEDMKEFLP